MHEIREVTEEHSNHVETRLLPRPAMWLLAAVAVVGLALAVDAGGSPLEIKPDDAPQEIDPEANTGQE